MAATWIPGRPSVVSALLSSSSRPANEPDSTCSFAFLTGVLPSRPLRAPLPKRCARRRLDHHRLLEFVLRLVVFHEAQLVMAHGHDVTVLQRMLLDELAVDVRSVGAVQILEE